MAHRPVATKRQEKVSSSFNVVLLHEGMVDKQGSHITTSLTLIDVHDICRSSCTYGAERVFIAHPSHALRKLARVLQRHWDEGYGATYNPDRREALSHVRIVSSLDESLHTLELETGHAPIVLATSAKDAPDRLSFSEAKKMIGDPENKRPFLMMLGTGWGMSDALLSRANYVLQPLAGPVAYNHLSVRSACAILLDRLFGV